MSSPSHAEAGPTSWMPDKLLQAAHEVRTKAHCIYSHYPVGEKTRTKKLPKPLKSHSTSRMSIENRANYKIENFSYKK